MSEPQRQLVRIDVSLVDSVAELHDLLARELDFPSFYGKNWNAFWDAITGLVEMPELLIIDGWSNVSTRWPDDANQLVGCLRDLNKQYTSFACDFELQW
jgi:RNAse (barnase) inhibitor barstar